MAYRNPPLDSTHQPFKRSTRLGPGPRNREGSPLKEKKIFECARDYNKKNVQLCVVVKDVKGKYKRGTLKIVKVDADYKKKYNKDYNKWLKALGRPRFRNAKAPTYRARVPSTTAFMRESIVAAGGVVGRSPARSSRRSSSSTSRSRRSR